jgi:hypothetical protein
MLALLKLIPLKDILWAAALIGAVWFVYHKGELRIEEKDAALRAAAIALNKASAQLADIKEIQIERTYTHIVEAPPVASTGLVCHAAAAVKPNTPTGGPEDPAKTNVLPTGSFDPSGPILTLLRDADAQVSALIDTVFALEAELQGQTK